MAAFAAFMGVKGEAGTFIVKEAVEVRYDLRKAAVLLCLLAAVVFCFQPL